MTMKNTNVVESCCHKGFSPNQNPVPQCNSIEEKVGENILKVRKSWSIIIQEKIQKQWKHNAKNLSEHNFQKMVKCFTNHFAKQETLSERNFGVLPNASFPQSSLGTLCHIPNHIRHYIRPLQHHIRNWNTAGSNYDGLYPHITSWWVINDEMVSVHVYFSNFRNLGALLLFQANLFFEKRKL